MAPLKCLPLFSLLVLLLCLLPSAHSEAYPAVSTFFRPSPFVINGIEAQIEDFPYVVSMRRNGVHIGGGAIISESWAISAAHILLGCPPTQLTLRAGSDQRMLGGSLHNGRTIIMHGSFSPHNMDFNIALIGVLEPFVFSVTVQPVPLDIQGTMVLPGTQGEIAGFGVTMPATNNLSNVMRYQLLTVQLPATCQSSLSDFWEVSSNMLCTASATHNPCHGDFGGALVANGNLIGIASWNPFCSITGYSTVFTRIASSPIRSFIRDIVGF